MVSTVDYAFQVQWLPLIEETMEEMEALTRNLSYRGHNITVENIEIHHVRNENCRIFIAAIGLLVAVLLVLLISSIIQLRNNNVELYKFTRKKIMKPVQRNIAAFICLALFLIASPLLAIFLFFCFLYRSTIFISLKLRPNFVKVMEPTDTIWAIENDKSYSIITAMAIVEIPDTKSPSEIYQKIRTRMEQRLFKSPVPYPKMFYKRRFFAGYFYWEEPNNPKIDEYVRELPIITNQETITKVDLDRFLAQMSNEQMDDNISWEVSVGTQRLDAKRPQYPLILRLHHTLGDGYALLQLLLEAISDDGPHFDTDMIRKYNSGVKGNSNPCCTLWAFLGRIWQCLYIPMLLFSQGVRKPDQNILHTNQELSGRKVVAWYSDKSGELLEQVKRIKKKVPNIRFCDVIVSAISVGFCRYFEKNGGNIPEYVTSVIPARAEMLTTQFDKTKLIELNNRFTVGVLTIPLCSNKQSIERLKRVHLYNEKLRNSMELGVNYWIINVLAGILPVPILAEMIYSRQCSAIISNIPGPEKISLGNDMVMDDLIFWIPNRGLTGVGISVFTYANRIQLGILADQIFVPTTEDAYLLLTDIVDELRHLDYATQSRY